MSAAVREAAEEAARANAQDAERIEERQSLNQLAGTEPLGADDPDAAQGLAEAGDQSPATQTHQKLLSTDYDAPAGRTPDVIKFARALGKIVESVIQAAFDKLPDLSECAVEDLKIGGNVDPSKVLIIDSSSGDLLAVGDGHIGGIKNFGDNMEPSTSSKRYTIDKGTLSRILNDMYSEGIDIGLGADIRDAEGNLDPGKLDAKIEELRANGAIMDARVSVSNIGEAVDGVQAAEAAATDAAAQGRSAREGLALPDRPARPANEVGSAQTETIAGDAKRSVGVVDNADLSGKNPTEVEEDATRVNNMLETKEDFIRAQQTGDMNGLIQLEHEKAMTQPVDEQSTHDQTASLALDYYRREFEKQLASGGPDDFKTFQKNIAPTHADMFFERYKFRDSLDNPITDFQALKDHFDTTKDDPAVDPSVKTARKNWIDALTEDEGKTDLQDSYCGDDTINNYANSDGATIQPPFGLDSNGAYLADMSPEALGENLGITIEPKEEQYTGSWFKKDDDIEGQFNRKKFKTMMKDREKLLTKSGFIDYMSERNHENFTGNEAEAKEAGSKEDISDEEKKARTENGKKAKDDKKTSTDSQQNKDSMMKQVKRAIMSFVIYYILGSLGISALSSVLSGFGRQMMDNQNGCWLAYLKSDGSDFEWKCKVRPLTCAKAARAKPSMGTLNTSGGTESLFNGSVLGNFESIQKAIAGTISSTSTSLFDRGPLTYTPCEICGAGGTIQGRKGMREAFSSAEQAVSGRVPASAVTSAAKKDFNQIYYPVWSPVPSSKKGVGATYPNKKLDNKKHVYSYSKSAEDGSTTSTLQKAKKDSSTVSCHNRLNTMPLFANLPDATWVNNTAGCTKDDITPTRSPFDGPVTSLNAQDGYNPEMNQTRHHNGPFPGTDVAAHDPCRTEATANTKSGETSLDCLTTATQFFYPGDTSAFETPPTSGQPPDPQHDSAYYSKINGPGAGDSDATPADSPPAGQGVYGASQCFQDLVKANNDFNQKLCADGTDSWCSTYCDKKQWPGIADNPRYKMVCVKNDEMQALNNLLGGALDPLLGPHTPFSMSNLLYAAYFIIIITGLHLFHSMVAG